MHHVRAPKATVRAEIEAAGFAFEREEKILAENYFLVFRTRR
jgi:predicted methyltransferase